MSPPRPKTTKRADTRNHAARGRLVEAAAILGRIGLLPRGTMTNVWNAMRRCHEMVSAAAASSSFFGMRGAKLFYLRADRGHHVCRGLSAGPGETETETVGSRTGTSRDSRNLYS